MQRLALTKIMKRGPTITTHDLLTNKVVTTTKPVEEKTVREHLAAIDIPEFMKKQK